jgi:hypothetical protein
LIESGRLSHKKIVEKDISFGILCNCAEEVELMMAEVGFSLFIE